MTDLDNKIKKFKELSQKSKLPQKRNKLSIFITIALISLLFIQAVNLYIQHLS